MKTFVRYSLVLWLLAFGVCRLSAEEPVRLVGASFVPSKVLLGDHFELVMEVEADKNYGVAFPEITPDFTEGRIELLADGPIDTLSREGEAYHLRKNYRMICFEPANYRIDSLGVLYTDGVTIDTLFAAEPLELTVELMPVDTAQKSIYDIKQPLKTPLVVEEFGGYVMAGIFLGALVASIVWLIANRRRRERVAEELPKEPAHVIAIRSLEILANQKLWQNGKIKEYYSRLTEILREYLSGRYGTGAMEMTTEEIVAAMRELGLNTSHVARLAALLVESDLVKFAKHTPTEEVHENSYNVVYYFVEETKEVAEAKNDIQQMISAPLAPVEGIAEQNSQKEGDESQE